MIWEYFTRFSGISKKLIVFFPQTLFPSASANFTRYLWGRGEVESSKVRSGVEDKNQYQCSCFNLMIDVTQIDKVSNCTAGNCIRHILHRFTTYLISCTSKLIIHPLTSKAFKSTSKVRSFFKVYVIEAFESLSSIIHQFVPFVKYGILTCISISWIRCALYQYCEIILEFDAL